MQLLLVAWLRHCSQQLRLADVVLANVDLAIILVEVDAVCDDGLFFDWPPLGGAS